MVCVKECAGVGSWLSVFIIAANHFHICFVLHLFEHDYTSIVYLHGWMYCCYNFVWWKVIRKLVNSPCRDGANTRDTSVHPSFFSVSRLKVAPKENCKHKICGFFFWSDHFDDSMVQVLTVILQRNWCFSQRTTPRPISVFILEKSLGHIISSEQPLCSMWSTLSYEPEQVKVIVAYCKRLKLSQHVRSV